MTPQMQRIVLEMRQAISSRISEISLEIHADLVENPPTGTPIDTGWASINWWPKVGSAPTGNDGATGDVNSRGAEQASGVAEVASYNVTSGKSIWVTNNVPYVGRLNDGWSQQAPAGFVEAAIERVLAKYRNRSL